MASCAKCNRPETDVSLKTCAKCLDTKYCSRECQLADWKTHKALCGQTSHGDSSSSPVKQSCLEKSIENPFERLANHIWLHERPERDVYRLIIDAYRLRMDDSHNMKSSTDASSIYNGAADGQAGFQCFVRRLETRPGLLPPWWSTAKMEECLKLGMDGNQWHSLRAKTNIRGITIRYGDGAMAMQLRMFAEAVYCEEGEEDTIDLARLTANYI